MPTADTPPKSAAPNAPENRSGGVRPLTPAAQRALAEAAARRAARDRAHSCAPKERGGPAGPEPTRYGDWEKGGIASDF